MRCGHTGGGAEGAVAGSRGCLDVPLWSPGGGRTGFGAGGGGLAGGWLFSGGEYVI